MEEKKIIINGHEAVDLGLIVNEGKIIDASFVVSPRQRNTCEKNKL